MPDINRATAIIAEELGPVLGPTLARVYSRRVVDRLDAEAGTNPPLRHSPGDIIRLMPASGPARGALMVVSKATRDEVVGFCRNPRGGIIIGSFPPADVQFTGGSIPFDPDQCPGAIPGGGHGLR